MSLIIISSTIPTIYNVSRTGIAVGWFSCTGEFQTITNKMIAIMSFITVFIYI
jgi:hypothetical protein